MLIAILNMMILLKIVLFVEFLNNYRKLKATNDVNNLLKFLSVESTSSKYRIRDLKKYWENIK